MTEAEWLASTDPAAMLTACRALITPGEVGFIVPGQIGQVAYLISDRKLRLLNLAWESPLCGELRQCLGTFEEDSPLGRCRATLANITNQYEPTAAAILREIVGNPFRPATVRAPVFIPHLRAFDYSTADPWFGWNNGAVPKMARSIYDGRRWDELPILADALDEAGCDSEELLRHLRGEGWDYFNTGPGDYGDGWTWGWRPLRSPHVWGCWALDLLLGRE